jgi:tripartite ATP-independent transporter DctP family solute receptor
MKKISLFFVITLILILTAIQPILATQVIRCGHAHPTSHSNQLCYEMFKLLIEMKTDKYQVEIYPNMQLGDEDEMVEMLKLGSLQALTAARYESMGEQTYTFGLPFLFKDFDHVRRVINGPIGDYIGSFAEDNGLKVLGIYHSGFRQITNNVIPIKSPADLKGLNIRTPPLESVLQAMRAFGANAMSMAFSELYMAMKTGVVDGQENPYENIASSSFYEVQKYVTDINYVYLPGFFVVGLDWWNSLPEEDQKIIAEAAKVAVMYDNYIVESTDEKYKQECIDQGMEIYKPTDEERESFIEKVQPVYDYFVEQGITTHELIELIQNS